MKIAKNEELNPLQYSRYPFIELFIYYIGYVRQEHGKDRMPN